MPLRTTLGALSHDCATRFDLLFTITRMMVCLRQALMAKFMVPAIVTILEDAPCAVTGKPE